MSQASDLSPEQLSEANDELLSMDEAIDKLRTTRPTFYRWLRSGRIKGLKVGRQWRFKPQDLERFLQGEAPRIDLPISIGPLLSELGLLLSEHITLPEVPENAAGALERMLQLAVSLNATSLHLEPVYLAEGRPLAVLRGRVDGLLSSLAEFDRRLLPPLIEQAKLLSHCDPHVYDRPQEGQFSFELADRRFELRTLCLPTGLGESLSIQILEQTVTETITLEKLALPEHVYTQLTQALKRGWGLIVASGPTGSGKTTTLHAALNHVAGPQVKTLALEDPIERYFPWVTSIGLAPGQSFGELLKAAMQDDPDVLMVAELREFSELEQVMRIALTGHLVLTNLHTSDSVQALRRLAEAGGNAYSVTESLSLIVNQRLVRKLCQECRRQSPANNRLPDALLKLLSEHGLKIPITPFWEAPGCKHCQTGYRGQIQLSEALSLTPELSKALLSGASADELRMIWQAAGGKSWLHDGMQRAAAGETSPEELLRVAGLAL